jgi:hypothetical protein
VYALRLRVRVCMCACACARVHVRVCMCACACACVHVRVCTCICSAFPLELIEAALSATLSAAHASNERDKRTVIASLSAALHDEDTPVLVAERAIRGRFAVAALRCTLDSGGSKQPLFGRCLEALELSGLTDVSINLTSCEAFSSKAAERLSSSLPPTLESCALYFHDLPTEVADDLVKAFSHGLINRLKRMRRVSLFSNSLEEDGGYALGKALQNACSVTT